MEIARPEHISYLFALRLLVSRILDDPNGFRSAVALSL